MCTWSSICPNGAKYLSRNLALRRVHTSFSIETRILKTHSCTPLGTRSYAETTNATLQNTSTVFRGTSFEKRCLHLLEAHLGMVLRRVGGKEDGGVDLNGWWWLPDVVVNTDEPLQYPAAISPSPSGADDVLQLKSDSKPPTFNRIRIIAQCKAEKKKIGPKYVRELEGVVWRYMASEKNVHLRNFDQDLAGNEDTAVSKEPTPVVAVFLSESPFTKSTILRAMSSRVPLLLIYVPPLAKEQTKNGHSLEDESSFVSSPGSCIYNPALGASGGLFKGELEVRWCWSLPTLTPSSSSLKQSPPYGPEFSQSSTHGAPALFFRGKQLRGCVPPGMRDFQEEI
ncbi:hypothetical protein FB446DRAFT_176763 [Lentinula raphanica]|nr:hypothetical protein FB446DRAFT_176763 [Lentinula raphanica]